MTALLLAAALAAAPEDALRALRASLDASAEWTMERTLPGSSRVLVSSGRVDCRRGEGIVWKVLAPFESSVAMTTNAMVFADEDGTRTKPLGELPHYAEIRAKTDAFAAGEADAFKGLFDLRGERLADGGWKLVLKPEVSAMERLVREIELAGAAKLTNVVMRTGDGGRSAIRFRETAREK